MGVLQPDDSSHPWHGCYTQRVKGLFSVSKHMGVDKKLSLCALWDRLKKIDHAVDMESARRVSRNPERCISICVTPYVCAYLVLISVRWWNRLLSCSNPIPRSVHSYARFGETSLAFPAHIHLWFLQVGHPGHRCGVAFLSRSGTWMFFWALSKKSSRALAPANTANG